MHLTNLEKVKKTKMDMEGAKGVDKQIPISKADGTPNFSFRVFTIEPGGHTPHHQHPFEHINYVIEGSGVALAGDRKLKIKKGDFALVLPGEMHQYQNTSKSKPFVMMCAVPKEYE